MKNPGLLILALFILHSTAAAQDDAPSLIGGDLGIYSKYVWRGMVFDEKPVLQSDLWMSTHGVTMVFWGNMDLTDENDEFTGQFNEWDVYITFPLLRFNRFEIGGEVDYLSFASSSGLGGAATAELSAWISSNFPGSPTLQIYWDVWQLHGLYTDFTLSHLVELKPGGLSFTGGLGWGSEGHNIQGGVADAAGLLDLQCSVQFSYKPHDLVDITPGVHFSSIVQSDIREHYDAVGVDPTNLFFSLNAAILFE